MVQKPYFLSTIGKSIGQLTNIMHQLICGEEAFPKDIIIDCDGVDLGLDTVIEKRRLINDKDL